MRNISRSPAGEAVLLGSPCVRGPQGIDVPVTRPQVQLVLTRLLWDGQPTTVDALAELMWGDTPLSDHWRGAVRGVVSKVRAVFVAAGVDAEVGITGDGRVTVTLPSGFTVDVQQARAAVEAADDAFSDDHAEQASALLDGWVDRLIQPVLPASDGEWVRHADEQVEELARRALTLQARAAMASDRPLGVESSLRSWVAAHPLDETAHHQLIEVLTAAGRRTDARAALNRLREILDRELGVGPAAATCRLLGEVEATSGPEPRSVLSATPADRTSSDQGRDSKEPRG